MAEQLHERIKPSKLYNENTPPKYSPDRNDLPIDDINDFEKIKRLKIENPKNVSLAYLNCNFAKTKNMHKQKALFDLINNNIDIVSLAETKLNESYNIGEFISSGYKIPYRLDVNEMEGVYWFTLGRTYPLKGLYLNLLLMIFSI